MHNQKRIFNKWIFLLVLFIRVYLMIGEDWILHPAQREKKTINHRMRKNYIGSNKIKT